MRRRYLEAELSPRQRIVLAALASRQGCKFAPVQVQKLFFLLDENIADEIGGKQFNFEPYDYGPFDKEVYRELDQLKELGLVEILNPHHRALRRYVVAPEGQKVGEDVAGGLSDRAVGYFGRVSDWVRSLSFAELVGSIYKEYPAMKEKSIFRG